jgi:hypothetical protein
VTAVITVAMPDQDVLRHFPEATTLAVLDAALVAVELALREEHPDRRQLFLPVNDNYSCRSLEPGVGTSRISEPGFG